MKSQKESLLNNNNNNDEQTYLPLHPSRRLKRPNPISDEINNTKDDILARLNKLIANCFPGKKWFGMVGKDNQLTFSLRGLSKSSANFLNAYFEGEMLDCKLIQKSNNYIVCLSDKQLENIDFFSKESQHYFDIIIKGSLAVFLFLETFASVRVEWYLKRRKIDRDKGVKRRTIFYCESLYLNIHGWELEEIIKTCILEIANTSGFKVDFDKLLSLSNSGGVALICLFRDDKTNYSFYQYLANSNANSRLQLLILALKDLYPKMNHFKLDNKRDSRKKDNVENRKGLKSELQKVMKTAAREVENNITQEVNLAIVKGNFDTVKKYCYHDGFEFVNLITLLWLIILSKQQTPQQKRQFFEYCMNQQYEESVLKNAFHTALFCFHDDKSIANRMRGQCVAFLEKNPELREGDLDITYHMLLSALLKNHRSDQLSDFKWCVEVLKKHKINVAEKMRSLDISLFPKGNFKNYERLNLIALVIEYDCVEIMRYCLEQNILSVKKVIEFNSQKMTLLQYSALKGTGDMVRLLVEEFDADPTVEVEGDQPYASLPCIFLTLINNNIEALEVLVDVMKKKNLKLNQMLSKIGPGEGMPLLTSVIGTCDLPYIKKLVELRLDYQFDGYDRRPFGFVMLCAAIEGKVDKEIIHYLFEQYGVDEVCSSFVIPQLMRVPINDYFITIFNRVRDFSKKIHVKNCKLIKASYPYVIELEGNEFFSMTSLGQLLLNVLGVEATFMVSEEINRYWIKLDTKNIRALSKEKLTDEMADFFINAFNTTQCLFDQMGFLLWTNISTFQSEIKHDVITISYQCTNEQEKKVDYFISCLKERYPELDFSASRCLKKNKNIHTYSILVKNADTLVGSDALFDFSLQQGKATSQVLARDVSQGKTTDYSGIACMLVNDNQLDELEIALLSKDCDSYLADMIEVGINLGSLSAVKMLLHYVVERFPNILNAKDWFPIIINQRASEKTEAMLALFQGITPEMYERWAQSAAAKAYQNEKVILDGDGNDSQTQIVLNSDDSNKSEEKTGNLQKRLSVPHKKTTNKDKKSLSIQQGASKVLELFGQVDLSEEQEKSSAKVKEFLLRIIRVVIHVEKWEPCDKGFYAIPKAKTNYDIRLHNAQVMLEYVWNACGFSNNDERVEVKHVDDGDWFIVTQALLAHANLVESLRDKKLVEKFQKMANKVIMIKHKLQSVPDLERTLAEMKNEPLDKVKKQDDWQNQKKVLSQRPKQPKERDNKKKKPRKQKQARVRTNQPLKTKKKNEEKRKNTIKPQSLRRYLDPCRINSGNTSFFSTTPGVRLDFAAPRKEIVPEDKADLPEKLDTTFDERAVLMKLDQLIDKLSDLIKTQSSNKYNRSVYVAGWHYLHAQLCNLLTHLPDDHVAKKYIFTPIGYSGKKLYDAQKHVYFPTGVPGDQANYCFKGVSAIKAQISYILDGHMPSEESAQKANAVVKAWVSYLNYEFNSDKCCLDEIIAAHNTLEEFGAWLADRIKEYTTCLKDLFKKYDEEQSVDEKQAIEYAIRFYVSRVGELAGHLPYNKRSKFLTYCRRFRNAVSHTYENTSDDENNNNNEAPEFDFVMLKKHLPDNNNFAFFSGKSQKADSGRFECFVNNKYHYSPETIALLAELKMNALHTKMPVVVSKPITFKVQTNVYAMLKESRDKLNSGSGLLLIPAKIESETGQSVPVAISLQFSKEGNLTEVAFSQVTAYMPHVTQCMALFAKKWCEASGQKGSLKSPKEVFPQIKADEIDNYGVMHVELLFRLAERKVKNGKTSAMPNEMKKVRDEHIRTMWRAGYQEHYVNQMLKRHVKPVVTGVIQAESFVK